jgi:phosphomannomutase
VVIGKDTRLSGYLIECALVAGFTSVGLDPLLLGPMSTPAVAMLTRSMPADAGVMISASHNAYEDNGIKLFGPDGHKLPDDIEMEIEPLLDSDLAQKLAAPHELGRARRVDDVRARYVEFAKRALPRNMMAGPFGFRFALSVKIAVDQRKMAKRLALRGDGGGVISRVHQIVKVGDTGAGHGHQGNGDFAVVDGSRGQHA